MDKNENCPACGTPFGWWDGECEACASTDKDWRECCEKTLQVFKEEEEEPEDEDVVQ